MTDPRFAWDQEWPTSGVRRPVSYLVRVETPVELSTSAVDHYSWTPVGEVDAETVLAAARTEWPHEGLTLYAVIGEGEGAERVVVHGDDELDDAGGVLSVRFDR